MEYREFVIMDISENILLEKIQGNLQYDYDLGDKNGWHRNIHNIEILNKIPVNFGGLSGGMAEISSVRLSEDGGHSFTDSEVYIFQYNDFNFPTAGAVTLFDDGAIENRSIEIDYY